MRTGKFKLILTILTFALSIIALWFVIQRAVTNKVWSTLNQDIGSTILIVLLFGFLLFLNDTFLVLSWQNLLLLFGEKKKPFLQTYWIYATTQIAKYIPGNFFQLPSRHGISLVEGYSNVPLLSSAAVELLGLFSAAGVVSIYGLSTGLFQAYDVVKFLPILFGISLICFLLLPLIARIKWFRRYLPEKWNQNIGLGKLIEKNAVILLYYILFFVVFGLVISLLTKRLFPESSGVPIPVLLSIIGFSYLVGLITPGAPAGLGVREAIMTALFTPFLGQNNALLITLLSRVINMAGDIFFYLAGLATRSLLLRRFVLSNKSHTEK